jgi:phenylpropionate dioxygenase-like ring-hydroxylating dioxygenase large terminal subunit
MKLETQHQLLSRAAAHLEAGTTDLSPRCLRVPAAHYTNASQLEREIEQLFRKQPLLVGLTPDVPSPGSFMTHEALDTALLIVRDDDNTVRAFINACRHRGTRIAEGRGTKRTFSCPFHAWNFSREGRLISRPNSCGGFDSTGAEFDALLERPCVEVAGMIFVLLDGDGIETKVQRLIGGIADEIGDYAIGEKIYFDGRQTERPCNYKFIVDGFAESYHLGSLHKATIAPYYYTHPSLSDRFGPVARMIGVRSSIDKEWTNIESERRFTKHGTIQYLIPPNIVLTHQVDHIQLWQIYPVDGDPNRCRVSFSLYWPAPLDEAARKKSQFNIDVLWQVTNEEDFPQSVNIHRNLASGAIPELVFGRNEPSLIHYHRQIAAAIGSDLLRDI